MSHQEITLGEHQASFDEATGTLSLFDDKQLVHLSADETYRLLIWLNDNYHERLHTLSAVTSAAASVSQGIGESQPPPDDDVHGPQQERA